MKKLISLNQKKLLRQFFKSEELPEGLTQRSLQVYKEIAQRAIAEGKDVLGEQAHRLELIREVLK